MKRMKNYHRTLSDEEIKTVGRIIDFIIENKIYRYTEIRDYALQSRPEWTDVLRKKNVRFMLIACTDSKKRVDDNARKKNGGALWRNKNTA